MPLTPIDDDMWTCARVHMSTIVRAVIATGRTASRPWAVGFLIEAYLHVGMTALLLFFSMAAIRAKFAAVHIKSLNHGPPQTATPFSIGL